MFEVEVAGTWTDSGVIAEEVKDVAVLQALRVFRSVRKGCGDDVSGAVRMKSASSPRGSGPPPNKLSQLVEVK